MNATGRTTRWIRPIALIGLALGAVAACGEADDRPTADLANSTTSSSIRGASTSSSPMSTPASTGGSATSVAPTTASTRGGTVFRGVTVASSQAATPPHDYWWVIDLANGATIDGSSRVLVEIPMDEVGCGPSMRHIDAFALEYGASVTFELVAGAPGDRPTYWFAEAQSFDSEPAVRGAMLRSARHGHRQARRRTSSRWRSKCSGRGTATIAWPSPTANR